MDGNGRWAAQRAKQRWAGHAAGVEALKLVVEAAPLHGIDTLTVFAFSADNWRRPKAEISQLMGFFASFIGSETAQLIECGVRLSVIGRRDRLGPGIVAAIARAEAATAGGTTLHLRIAIDYSARAAILQAANMPAADVSRELTIEEFSLRLCGDLTTSDVDLIIRTSGEQRLSDFLLWEVAYAELHFTERLWPDFGPQDLALALHDYATRDRRFGAIPEQVSAVECAEPKSLSAHPR